MSRTALYKMAYFGLVLGPTALMVWFVLTHHRALSIPWIALVIVLLLLPGRVLAYFWRDLLRGLHLLKQQRFEESKHHSEAFLVTLKQKPWLKNLIWLGFGTYSRSPACFALNNLGAAEVGLGETENARVHLVAAIQTDGASPLPYFNMGALAASLNEHDEARTWYEKAAALGYSRSVIDAIIVSSQSRLARSAGDS